MTLTDDEWRKEIFELGQYLQERRVLGSVGHMTYLTLTWTAVALDKAPEKSEKMREAMQLAAEAAVKLCEASEEFENKNRVIEMFTT